jgi:hypothetical protein
MTRTKQAARKGKPNKRPNPNSQKGNPQDAPPSKKARKNPPPSASVNTTMSNATPVETNPTPPAAADQSNVAFPIAECPPNTVDLTRTHDLTTMTIISSTQIQTKVLRVLENLSVYPAPPNEKPRVVMMKAKAGVASKMISIAEIAKREIGKGGGKWFQYNAVEGVMEELQMEVKKGKKATEMEDKEKGRGGGEGEGKEEEESEEETTAFETMKTPFERVNEEKAKVRAVPNMSLYLARVRIDSLRKAYA